MLQRGRMWCDGRVIQVDNAACLGENNPPGQARIWCPCELSLFGIWADMGYDQREKRKTHISHYPKLVVIKLITSFTLVRKIMFFFTFLLPFLRHLNFPRGHYQFLGQPWTATGPVSESGHIETSQKCVLTTQGLKWKWNSGLVDHLQTAWPSGCPYCKSGVRVDGSTSCPIGWSCGSQRSWHIVA